MIYKRDHERLTPCSPLKPGLAHETLDVVTVPPIPTDCSPLKPGLAHETWRYAGLDPTVTWGKGQKRPWNARLKTLSWKAGQSFMKVSGRDDAFYGKLYLQRKAYEQQNNEAGKYAAQARQMISQRNYSPDTEAYAWYSRGMLPPSHILARATRWVEKIFLAHWFMVAYEAHYNQPAPRPYAIEHLGHKDIYLPPHWPLIA
jgi:hypothetical protein